MKNLILFLGIFTFSQSIFAQTAAQWDKTEVFRIAYKPFATVPENAQKQVIADIRARTENLTKYAITVSGHTDSAGPAEKNFKISELRALGVKESLVETGINAAMIETKWYGETEPYIDRGANKLEPLNRRVEITLYSMAPPSP